MNDEGSEMQQLIEADITAFLHFIYMGRLPADPGMDCIGMCGCVRVCLVWDAVDQLVSFDMS